MNRAGTVVDVIATVASVAATWRWSVEARDAAVPRIVHAACRDGDLRRLAELEARGVELTGAWAVPPLGIAAKSGGLEIVRFLLERGADVNQVGKFTTPLELAVQGGQLEATRLLLDHGARADLQGNEWPLAAAVRTCSPALVRLLRGRGAPPLEDAREELSRAERSGCARVAELRLLLQ